MVKPLKSLTKGIFDKAELESGSKTKNGWCNHLELTFRDDLKVNEGTSSKSFARLYDKYIAESHPENADPKPALLEAMSQYIGFSSYREFLMSHKELETEDSGNPVKAKKKSKSLNKERIVILLLGLIIFLMLMFNFVTGNPKDPKCMIWRGDQFVGISCDLSNHPQDAGKIQTFDKKLFKNMKLIPPAKVVLGSSYYYKFKRDSLEFYSWGGKHPVNGIDLKPVTSYIIEKYVKP